MTHPLPSVLDTAPAALTTGRRPLGRRTSTPTGPAAFVLRLAAALALVLVTAGLLPTSAHAATTVSGNVTCVDGRSVVGVWVDASNGGSGWATRSDINGSTQRYSYPLANGGTYSVRVGCGGTGTNWATSNSSGVVSGSSNSFTCYDVPNYGYAYLRCQRT
jgi:hypothetical protein